MRFLRNPERETMSYLDTVRKAKDELKRTQAPADLIDDSVIAVLIDSTILGAPIWFALRDDWRPDAGDTTPIFYASELPALRMKTPEQLRDMFQVKRVFGGGWIRDRREEPTKH